MDLVSRMTLKCVFYSLLNRKDDILIMTLFLILIGVSRRIALGYSEERGQLRRVLHCRG